MTIKVKPLVWVRVPESRELGMEPYDHAEGFGGSYIVEHRAAGHFDMWKPNLSCGDRFALESAAKAAAQAHHEAAVRAQIEAVEEVDPAAIRAEAWKKLAGEIGDLGDDLTRIASAVEHGLPLRAYGISDRILAIVDKEQDQ